MGAELNHPIVFLWIANDKFIFRVIILDLEQNLLVCDFENFGGDQMTTSDVIMTF